MAANIPRYNAEVPLADIGVVKVDTRTVGSEWGALSQVASQIGEDTAKEAVAQQDANATLEAISAGVSRDTTGALTLPTPDTSTRAGRIRAGIALKNYEVQFRLDAAARGQEFAAEALAANDPKLFDTKWNAWAAQTLAMSPGAVRGLATTILEGKGNDFRSGLFAKQQEQEHKLSVQNLGTVIDQNVNDIFSLASVGQGAGDKANGLFGTIRDDYAGLVRLGVLTHRQAAIKLEKIKDDMGVLAFKGATRKIWDDGVAAGLTHGEILGNAERFVDEAARDPNFQATVEQRGRMVEEARSWIQARAQTVNIKIVEQERIAAKALNTDLINFRVRQIEMEETGNWEGAAQLSIEIKNRIESSGDRGMPFVEALSRLHSSLARYHKEADEESNKRFTRFMQRNDGAEHIRQVLSGSAEDYAAIESAARRRGASDLGEIAASNEAFRRNQKTIAGISDAVRQYNSENGTALTYEDAVREIRDAPNSETVRTRADTFVRRLEPQLKKLEDSLKVETRMNDFQRSRAPLDQSTVDKFTAGNPSLIENPNRAAAFYDSVGFVAAYDKEVFSAGRRNSLQNLVRGSTILSELPEHLKAGLPNRPFWEYMVTNIRGRDPNDPETNGAILKLAGDFDQRNIQAKAPELASAIQGEISFSKESQAGINAAITKMYSGNISYMDRIRSIFVFGDAAEKERQGNVARTLPEHMPPEMLHDISNIAANLSAQFPIAEKGRILEMATTEAIKNQGWASSLAASTTGRTVWVRNSAEAGFAKHGLTNADTTNFLANLIDYKTQYAGTVSAFKDPETGSVSIGRELLANGRVSIRPASGPLLDPNKGYAFQLHIKNEDGVPQLMSDGGNTVFYASRKDAILAGEHEKNTARNRDLLTAMQAAYRDGGGMSSDQLSQWERFVGLRKDEEKGAKSFGAKLGIEAHARVLAAEATLRTEWSAFSRWSADQFTNNSASIAIGKINIGLHDFLERWTEGESSLYNPATGTRVPQRVSP